MAVETKFVVVRKGEEKMTFASKKEADAYDKMLDMADVFADWLAHSSLSLDEAQAENLGLFLAEHKDIVQHILRTSSIPTVGNDSHASTTASTADVHSEPRHDGDAGKKKISAVKAA
ncbi:hypothetical protein SODG_006199 [Sodalis praecaptivus]